LSGKFRFISELDIKLGVADWNICFTRASRFVEWFTNSDETIDGKSKSKAYALFESNLIDNIEVLQ
jgi:cell filamentation protein